MPRAHTRLCFHIVFATKGRHPWIAPVLASELYPFLGAIVRDQGGSLIAVGGMPDHVHLLVALRPHPSVATVVKAIKGNSSRWINESRRAPEHFAWQEGYAAFSVSESVLSRVQAYVLNQERHHRQTSFQDEQANLLEKHRVPFKPDELLEAHGIPV
jgi:putative transposase